MIRIYDIPVILITIFLAFVPIYILLISSGSLVIHKDYFDEWEETKQQLETCKESKIPECTPVKCGGTNSILGFVYLIMGLGMFLYGENKLSKSKEETKKKKKKK